MMRHDKRRSIYTVLLITLILSVSGCGRKAGEDTVPETGISAGLAEESSPDASPAHEDDGRADSDDAAEPLFYGSVEEGGYVITTCTSKEDVIEVPDRIEGAPVVRIGENAFYELTCRKIILPDSVTSIGEYAFFFCESLEEIELGSGLKRVGAQVFANCPCLKSVTFPEGLESIACPFYMNDELGDVYIPSSVTEITDGIGSPDTCPKMVVVTPKGSAAEAQAIEEGYPVRNEGIYDGPAVNEAAEEPVLEDAGDEQAMPAVDAAMIEATDAALFEGHVEGDGYTVTGCLSDDRYIRVPDKIEGRPVTVIAASAFALHTSYIKIILPDTVQSIQGNAFAYCSGLREIELGTGLKHIGSGAFCYCTSLERVSFPDGMESMQCPFYANEELGEVYIPASVTEIIEFIAYPSTCSKMVVVTPSGSDAEKSALETGLPVRNK